MKNTQTEIHHCWYDKFQCIGGPCSVSCCRPSNWQIGITDEELLRYKNLEPPFRDEVLGAINMEKQVFRSKGDLYGKDAPDADQCALQTKEGWCKIVLNCGEEYLTQVCHVYPRSTLSINDTHTCVVDISCPVACEYLFDNEPMNRYSMKEVPFSAKTDHIDESLYHAVCETRDFLMDLFLNVEGFSAGKCFILFDIVNSLQDIISNDSPEEKNYMGPRNKYASDETIISILTECENIGRDMDQKSSMAGIAIKLFYDILMQIPQIDLKMLADMEAHLKEWKDFINLKEDLREFYEYRDAHFPGFIDKFISYRIFLGMFPQNYTTISKEVKAGYISILLEEIAAMSYWKSNKKEISVADYAKIISKIERSLDHSPKNKAIMVDSLETIEKELKFSLFLLPVY